MRVLFRTKIFYHSSSIFAICNVFIKVAVDVFPDIIVR